MGSKLPDVSISINVISIAILMSYSYLNKWGVNDLLGETGSNIGYNKYTLYNQAWIFSRTHAINGLCLWLVFHKVKFGIYH